MVWITKRDLTVEYVNRRYTAYTGEDAAALAERGILAGFHPDDLPAAAQRWAVAQKERAVFELQHRLRAAATGGYRWHLSRAEPMLDAAGEVQQWFGTSTDIDDQKRLEERQAAQMHESELARRQAEELNRAKDEFLAVLSHELRTPLHAILGWLQLSRSSSRDEIVLALTRIERNARALGRLIEDLLDVSRIVSGKFDITRSVVDLSEVLYGAAEVVQPAADERGVRIAVEVPPDVGVVLGDPSRLQQVAWNLLTNAIHCSEAGTTVVLEASAEGEAVRFAVHDQGCGIAAGFLAHVFERFRQEDSSTTRRRGGLGLGLSIVKHLVAMHGGAIAAESAGPGQGASFTVTLPMAPDGARARHPSAVPPPPDPASEALPLQGLRVLLADDDDDSREMLTHALERRGAEVTGVCSAAECRARYVADEPDALVSDIGMPGEDGYALMADLRARGAAAFAVALTGYASVEDRDRARRAGFDAHLTKPVRLDALVAALLRAQSRPSRSMSSSSSPK